eukprot:TRINITY_DN448_c0_g3_i1.p1 TRINITY_DN448_c0_g3~~TRINITY_DN448_c0_g3_i1.p1  ORF type:complete len:228 (+),score=63.12 TRINITY_DN448_c0_g3_i1:55-684(+)
MSMMSQVFEGQELAFVALLLEIVQFMLHSDFVAGDVQVPKKAFPYVDAVRITMRGSFDLMSMCVAVAVLLGMHDFTLPEVLLVGTNAATHMLYIVMYILPVHKVRDFFYHSVALSFALFTKYPMKPGNTTTGYSLNADGTISFVKEWAFVKFSANFLAYVDLATHIYLVTILASYVPLHLLVPVAAATAYVAGQRVSAFQDKLHYIKMH